jgi:hypothetical protein
LFPLREDLELALEGLGLGGEAHGDFGSVTLTIETPGLLLLGLTWATRRRLAIRPQSVANVTDGKDEPMSVDFVDTGLRLGVLEALLEAGHFEEERESLGRALDDLDTEEDYGSVVSARLRTWTIDSTKLEEILELDIDGGNEIYALHASDPDEGWSGCDRDEFVVANLGDLRHLPNLSSLSIVALLTPDLDLAPLTTAPALKKVFLDLHEPTPEQRAVLETLARRGVEVGPAALLGG